MTAHDQICKKIALDNNLHSGVVDSISKSQFEFVTEVMAAVDETDPDTWRGIRLQYFGVFTNYTKKSLEKKAKRLKEKENQ